MQTFRMILIAFVVAGSTLLASAQAPVINHNTWTSGAPLPTARMGAAAGAIGADIYVIDGWNNSSILGVNEIYNPKKNTWTTGASDPNPRAWPAYAVVNKILYVFGGSNGAEFLDLTESYDPATDTWTTLAPAPYAQYGATAVADKDVIYLMGGATFSGAFLTNVASYNTTTNTWTDESPLLVGRDFFAAGLLGTTVVAADGQNSSGVLGDNEGYSAKANAWTELNADPTPRVAACWAAIKGDLYVAGGTNGTLLNLTESYNAKTKSWTTLAPMPTGIWFAAASATAGGKLYCFGGGQYEVSVNNNVQIYQP